MFSINKREKILLFLFFFLAFFLRIKASISSEVWIDELTVHSLTSSYSYKDLFFINHYDTAHPPLFYILSRLLMTFGSNFFVNIEALRLPHIFLSSLAVYPLYLLAKKFVKGINSFFIPLWYSVHYYFIEWGYTMRPYGLLFFLFPLGILLSLKYFWRNKKSILLANVFYIILFYWDYASIWFFVTIFTYFFIKKKLFLRIFQLKWFFISVLIWLPTFIKKFDEAIELESYLKVNFHTFIKMFDYFSGLSQSLYFGGSELYINFYNSLFNKEYWYSYISVTLLLIILIVNFIIFVKNRNKNILTIFYLGVILPSVISYTYSVIRNPISAYSNLTFVAIMLLFLFSPILRYKKNGLIFGLTIFLLFAKQTYISFGSIGHQERLVSFFSYIDIENTRNINLLSFDNTSLTYPAILYKYRLKGLKPCENNISCLIYKNKPIYFFSKNIYEEKEIAEQEEVKNIIVYDNKNFMFEEHHIQKTNQLCSGIMPSFDYILNSEKIILAECSSK